VSKPTKLLLQVIAVLYKLKINMAHSLVHFFPYGPPIQLSARMRA